MFKNAGVRNAVLTMMLAVSFFGLGLSEIKAVWGTLDASFGSAGTFSDSGTNSYPNSVLVQPDGKILVTGYSVASNGTRRFMLRRWTASGAIDTTFGNNGAAVINVLVNANSDYGGGRITMLSGGKIAVVGQAGTSLGIWVVNSNGYGDTNFGYNGYKVMTDYHYAHGRVGARGAKILLGVFHKNYRRVIIHQLNADGSDDTSFGSEGRSYTGIFHDSGASPAYEMITAQPQNKITIGSISIHPQYGYTKRIERVNQDGSIDFTFTPTQTAVPVGGSFNGFARLSSGEYVYTDMQSIGVDFHARLYKLNANGTANIDQPIADANSLIGIQSNGRAIVGNGFTENLDRHDAAFNFLDTAATGYNSGYYLGAVQTDDKLVIATRANNKLTLFRWLAN